ncbi:MlaD family protein [Cyanobium sp. NS01]|uniref:MlaD family protein n=1 Tax=Cyanobium sp. NS01 TaxID=261284 RepID=UPI0016462474|nr:MlaD family protein [Cyanobium sp. NS01]QNI70346.1 mce related family protein [Cyanobium sp. NS01]
MSSPANGDGPALAELPSTQPGWRPPVSRLGGLFLAGSLLLMGWVAGNLIHERMRWRGSSVVDFRTDKAMGLWPGVNVTLSGYRIGKVESVKLASDGRVDVRLRIASAYRRLVGPKSRATALQEGLIGDTVVTLSPDIAPPDADGPPAALTVPFNPSSSPADLLSDLAKTRLQLDRTLQAIAAVVEKDLPTVTNQVDGTLGDVRRLVGTLERESGATAKATRDTLRLYQQTGAAMGEASSEATEVMKTTSPVLVETLQQISTASATTNKLLKRLAGTFLFDLPDTEPAVAPQQEALE